MRWLVPMLVLCVFALPLSAEDAAKPVSEKEALDEVRALLDRVRAKAPEAATDLTPWGLRPSSMSRYAFGKDYDNLTALQKLPVDKFHGFVMGGMLETFGEALERSEKEPALATTPIKDGSRRVACSIAKDTFLFVIARRGKDGTEIVDLGAKGKLFGSMLRAGWQQGKARAPADKPVSELLLSLIATLVKKIQDKARKVKSKDNIRSLLTLLIARRTEKVTSGWPPFGGKSFVLCLVAYGDLDVSKESNRDVLFSPNVPKAVRPRAGAYREVTMEALKAGRDWSKALLTTHAGRRNDERDYVITPDQEKMGTILIADLSFPDVVIAGYTNGTVKELTRKDLGLGPNDPIVVGDKSKNEELRKLSLR